MPTNEAVLSGGKDQGDGGRTTASDTPGGERNAGVGQDRTSPGQSDTGHLGAAGDPAEGKTETAGRGQTPEAGPGSDADQASQAPHVG